jgi:hypothetical protein
MRAAKHTRRGPTHRVSTALVTTGLLTAALLATAVLATSASAPAALTRVTTTRVTPTGSGASAGLRLAAPPGWRVVTTIGPYNQGVSGTLTAHSAADAWSVWTGTSFTAVERLTGTRWTRVTLPAKLTAYVRSAVASDGDSATDFWLFSSYRPTQALRFTGTGWTLAPIPSWVLRKSGGGLSTSTAVFGPGNVWVFALGAGGYAAHYNGHAWAKVRLPGTPDDVSAVSADDIWALAGSVALHWNGQTWAAIKIPVAAKKPAESFGSLAAAGPRSAWVLRTIGATRPGTDAEVLHWNGTRWQRVAGTPADLVDSMVPDGSGGLWATAVDINPGGFNLFYHLTGGRWTAVDTPTGIWDQVAEYLTWIPGTHSVWGTAEGLTDTGNYGVLLKYGQ